MSHQSSNKRQPFKSCKCHQCKPRDRNVTSDFRQFMFSYRHGTYRQCVKRQLNNISDLSLSEILEENFSLNVGSQAGEYTD